MVKQLKMPPVHPGETLQRQFFKPLSLSREELAQDLHLPLYQLEDLIEGRSRIDADLAYRLGRYFQVEPEGFLSLQQIYDLEV